MLPMCCCGGLRGPRKNPRAPFSRNGYFHDKSNLNIIGTIVSTGYPANDATYRRRVMEITKRFQQYHLRIERKTFEMRYQPETDRCLGKGEKL